MTKVELGRGIYMVIQQDPATSHFPVTFACNDGSVLLTLSQSEAMKAALAIIGEHPLDALAHIKED